MLLMVIPMDAETPGGRLLRPQAQVQVCGGAVHAGGRAGAAVLTLTQRLGGGGPSLGVRGWGWELGRQRVDLELWSTPQPISAVKLHPATDHAPTPKPSVANRKHHPLVVCVLPAFAGRPRLFLLSQEEAIRHWATVVSVRLDLDAARGKLGPEAAEAERRRFGAVVATLQANNGPALVVTDSQVR